jgi:hypothetical protein
MQSKRVMATISMMGWHTAPLFADHPRQRAAEFDFAGGVGPVAEFVLQTLDIELVAGVVRAMTRQQKTGQAFFSLRQGQERIAHRRRTEPLVSHQLIRLARPGLADRVRASGVRTHIGAALFLGHGHADRGPGLVGNTDVARVVLGGKDFR